MDQPPRFKQGKDLACKLHKALYSLKQLQELDLGELNYFLGIEVKQVAKGFHLSQRKCINDVLKKMKMNNANPLPTPMVGGHLKRKQHTVSRSTTEAKYKSLANATSELIWISSFLIELKIKQNAPRTVWCDNLSTVGLGSMGDSLNLQRCGVGDC
ncbi:hypothetical protein AAG906_013688 [Vitis piasezkii]